MTAAVALRTEAEAAGVPMRLAAGGGLKLSGSASLELLGRLREHRAEILALLQAEAVAVADRRPDIRQRATALADEAEMTARGEELS
jgi:hypothetical protein